MLNFLVYAIGAYHKPVPLAFCKLYAVRKACTDVAFIHAQQATVPAIRRSDYIV